MDAKNERSSRRFQLECVSLSPLFEKGRETKMYKQISRLQSYRDTISSHSLIDYSA